MPEDISAVPNIPESQSTTTGRSSRAIKIATPDIILPEEFPIPIDLMTDLIFEDIGGQEIISISRNDIINGQDVSYILIGNTKLISRKYSSLNIFSLPGTIENYFRNFSIRLDIHIPEKGTGPVGERVYLNNSNNLIIDVVNMQKNERVDVEILKRGNVLSDTMYITLEES
jgi:hypothetical protein